MLPLINKIKSFIARRPAVLLLVPLFCFFFFGLIHLTKFETVDEHYWIYSNRTPINYWQYNNGRIQQYWSALFSQNWAKTRINDKPGITLAYVSGIGPWLASNLDTQIDSGKIAPMTKTAKAEMINFYFRFPLLLFNGLFSLVFFVFIRKLTKNDWVALFSAAFILLSPILLGISQIINPDSLLWVFSFASLLAFLIHLQEKSRGYALWAGLFLGLALLTKYSSLIFFPFFFVVMLAYFVENMSSWDAAEIPKRIRFYVSANLFIMAGALLVYAILLPDNLVNLDHFMEGSIGFKGMKLIFATIFLADALMLLDAYFFKSRFVAWVSRKTGWLEKYFKLALLAILPLVFIFLILNTLFGKDIFQLFTIPFDASTSEFFGYGISLKRIVARQFLPLVFSLSPLVILGAVYAWFKNLRSSSEFQWVAFVFSLFIAVFMAAMIQQKIPLSIRYSIMLYPPVLALAAIGFYQLFSLEKKTLSFGYGIFICLIIAGIISLWQAKPFYFNYTNILLPQQYIIADGWGYGGYEAAQYLNALPGADKMRVWSDYNGFCVFFNGGCLSNTLTMKTILNRGEKSGKLSPFNYFVSTRRGNLLSSSLWNELKENYRSQNIFQLDIGGQPQNFVTIYKNSTGNGNE